MTEQKQTQEQTQTFDYNLGDIVDCQYKEAWQLVEIINKTPETITIHFISYKPKYDKTFDINKIKLAPPGTHTKNTQKLFTIIRQILNTDNDRDLEQYSDQKIKKYIDFLYFKECLPIFTFHSIIQYGNNNIRKHYISKWNINTNVVKMFKFIYLSNYTDERIFTTMIENNPTMKFFNFMKNTYKMKFDNFPSNVHYVKKKIFLEDVNDDIRIYFLNLWNDDINITYHAGYHNYSYISEQRLLDHALRLKSIKLLQYALNHGAKITKYKNVIHPLLTKNKKLLKLLLEEVNKRQMNYFVRNCLNCNGNFLDTEIVRIIEDKYPTARSSILTLQQDYHAKQERIKIEKLRRETLQIEEEAKKQKQLQKKKKKIIFINKCLNYRTLIEKYIKTLEVNKD